MVKVVTDEYARSHGKEPRGRGYWAFRFGRDPIFVRNESGQSELKYSEAKSIAQKIAEKAGFSVIYVCP